jgi:adenosine kinase
MGAVGNDDYGNLMREKCKEVGLNPIYQVKEDKSTGTCAVLITGKERSLVAHLGAANFFTPDHLDNDHHWSFVEKAQFIYVSGFFFTVSPDTIMRLAKFANENNRIFAINLSAGFLSQFYGDKLMAALPYVDILCGNEDEAEAFSEHVLKNKTKDIHEIAKAIANLPKLNNKKRIVIITQGSNPVVYVNNDELKEVEVPKLDQSLIVDTNGAGDAFMVSNNQFNNEFPLFFNTLFYRSFKGWIHLSIN